MDRILKIGFFVFAVCAIVFGFIRVGQNIRLSLAGSEQAGTDTQLNINDAVFDEVKQRVLDTDEDGLKDWDELNTYGTSPYLADTDSDGTNDAQEVEAGEDPTCAAGRTCGSSFLDTAELGGIGTQQPQDSTGASELEGAFAEPGDAISDESASALDALREGGDVSADDIRALLRDAGVSEQELEAATDKDLLDLFSEVLKQTQ